MQNALPPHKPKERVWLKTKETGVPHQFLARKSNSMESQLGREFMLSGSPFIPLHFGPTRRKINRLARFLSQKLIGFAMGSGAAYGYSIIGMLKVMEREGIYPDIVSGTSMGALLGAFYSSGMTPAEIEGVAKSISRAKLWSMSNLAIPRSGFLTGKGILKFLREHLGDKTFNDLTIPFACVATDIQTGKEIVLDEGNVAQSVRASLSLPVLFQPYYMNGRYLVDGGLVNPVPNSVLLSQGANILLSANLTSKPSGKKTRRRLGNAARIPILRGPSIPSILMKTIYTMQYEIATTRSKIANVVMDISSKDILWWDLNRASEIIHLGEAAAEENMPKIKSLIPYYADSCRVRFDHKTRESILVFVEFELTISFGFWASSFGFKSEILSTKSKRRSKLKMTNRKDGSL